MLCVFVLRTAPCACSAASATCVIKDPLAHEILSPNTQKVYFERPVPFPGWLCEQGFEPCWELYLTSRKEAEVWDLSQQLHQGPAAEAGAASALRGRQERKLGGK